MKAAVFDEFGGPEVLRIERVPVPVPDPGEVLVRVRASGLNHLDLWLRRGLPIETTMPHIGGSDIAGEVMGVGAGAGTGVGVGVGTRVLVNPSVSCGDCEWCDRGEEPLCADYKIIGEHLNGGFAEYVVVPAANLLAIPDSMSFEDAAAAPLVYLTAWRGLMTRGRLKPGETVLVTGASGGVATAAIQIAKYAGAKVLAVTSTTHVERVRALGADVVYDRTNGEFSKQLWTDTGKRGVDVVLDSTGEALWAQNVRSLARGGRLVVYGATTGPKAELDLRVVFWKQIEIIGTTMSNRTEFGEVMTHVFSGALKPVIDTVMPLEQIREAHERLERGDAFGKIVLIP
jgi:NADPH:quinone reductase-like Zn-dependent oxidoreductase